MQIKGDDGTILNPTHKCFDDASDIFINLIREGHKDALLCHAICLKPDNTKFAHAWVEVDNNVMFKAVIDGKEQVVGGCKDDYYKIVRPQDITRYTPHKAVKISERFGGGLSGPWKPKYLRLCRDYKKGN